MTLLETNTLVSNVTICCVKHQFDQTLLSSAFFGRIKPVSIYGQIINQLRDLSPT